VSALSQHPFTVAAIAGVAALAACTAEAPTRASVGSPELSAQASVGKVAVCHRAGTPSTILEVGAPALADHLAHGDYVTTLLVDHAYAGSVDGVHFGRIGDALSAAAAGRLARGELVAADCRITIAVSSGVYSGTAGPADGDVEHFPFVVDVPDITLHGALVMGLDAAGRATGEGVDAGATTLSPVEPLPVVSGASTPIVIADAHPGGSAGNGLVVEGFVFQSGHDPAVDAGGQGILSVRAVRLVVRGNRFEGGFTESLDLRASAAEVTQNHLAGTAGTCDICLAGPGTYTATGNKLLAGGIPGITVSSPVGLPLPAGVEPLVLPAAAETWGYVRNNEVRDHLRKPVGVGIRVEAVGTGAPNVHGTVHAVIQGNLLVNDRFGIIVHGGFPTATTDRRGDADVTLGGNTFQQTCQANLLVALVRHTTALGLANTPWLLYSTFQIALNGDLAWDDAWYGHAAGYGNTLIVDGATIPNGGRQFYDAAGCPGLAAQ
jgi:hypothetical protein